MREKSLIVGVDGSEGSRAAVDEAIDLAGNLSAAVTFVFVCKSPSWWLGDPYYQRALSGDLVDARRAVAEAVETATAAGIEAYSEILEGDPADELVSLGPGWFLQPDWTIRAGGFFAVNAAWCNAQRDAATKLTAVD